QRPPSFIGCLDGRQRFSRYFGWDRRVIARWRRRIGGWRRISRMVHRLGVSPSAGVHDMRLTLALAALPDEKPLIALHRIVHQRHLPRQVEEVLLDEQVHAR